MSAELSMNNERTEVKNVILGRSPLEDPTKRGMLQWAGGFLYETNSLYSN